MDKNMAYINTLVALGALAREYGYGETALVAAHTKAEVLALITDIMGRAIDEFSALAFPDEPES